MTTDEIMALAMACRSRVVDDAVGAERELRAAVGALVADRDAKASQINALIVDVRALIKTLEKVEAERDALRAALDVATQFVRAACDWSIDEAEIDGVMTSTYDVLERLESAVKERSNG